VARRVEALDLLVAQARVGLANAVLVQQLELLKQTYQDQATRDQLTGLLNRRGLVLTAEQLPGHLGVLFCDLDGFKGINDTLGHAAGDELLEKVARRLESQMREDSVLGRMGGDEFVVVVPGASDDDLAGLGRRIEIDLGRPFLLEAGMARIGVSIGAAHAAPGERDLDDLLGQAGQLMYEVKRGRKAGRTIDVYRASATWTSTSATWGMADRPAPAGTAVGAAAGTTGWHQWTVPALVTELYAGPDHGFLVKDRVDNAGPARTTVYDSLDSGTVNRPQLVLTWG
jgi:diguanylate cyclase (GGDEF)-like protein